MVAFSPTYTVAGVPGVKLFPLVPNDASAARAEGAAAAAASASNATGTAIAPAGARRRGRGRAVFASRDPDTCTRGTPPIDGRFFEVLANEEWGAEPSRIASGVL